MSLRPIATVIVRVFLVIFGLIFGVIGCKELPSPPTYDNPYDPLGPSYRVKPPYFGPIEATVNRQVTLRFYGIDDFAESILIERRNGPTEQFAFVASVPAAQKSYSEYLPPTQYPDFYYRARCRAIGGSLSPYATSPTVYFGP